MTRQLAGITVACIADKINARMEEELNVSGTA